jgi:hypothetical protein
MKSEKCWEVQYAPWSLGRRPKREYSTTDMDAENNITNVAVADDTCMFEHATSMNINGLQAAVAKNILNADFCLVLR